MASRFIRSEHYHPITKKSTTPDGMPKGPDRDSEIGSKEEAAYDLKWLKKILAVPVDKVQRALVVRFWAGDDKSKIRYLINERLWDESW
jgi:hypothetical protein